MLSRRGAELAPWILQDTILAVPADRVLRLLLCGVEYPMRSRVQRMMTIVLVIGAFAFVVLTVTGLWRPSSVYELTSSP